MLLLLHHEDDNHPDRFYQMNRQMTVFGFGRQGLNKFLDKPLRRFSLRFLETTDHAPISRAVISFLHEG